MMNAIIMLDFLNEIKAFYRLRDSSSSLIIFDTEVMRYCDFDGKVSDKFRCEGCRKIECGCAEQSGHSDFKRILKLKPLDHVYLWLISLGKSFGFFSKLYYLFSEQYQPSGIGSVNGLPKTPTV